MADNKHKSRKPRSTKPSRAVSNRTKKAASKKLPAKPELKKRFRLLPNWFVALFKLAIVGVVVLAAGLIYLDATLRKDLDAVQWELPAQVYARPLELYVGKSLTLSQLRTELKALGYRFENVNRTGYVQSISRGLAIRTRGFHFEDGFREEAICTVRIRNGQVSDLVVNGRNADIFRLEPLLVGSLFPNHHEDRQLVPLNQLPKALKQALIATEDREFYKHHGVSPKAIMRAMMANFQAGGVVQGGSTLTQQLIKNLYLTRERTYTRKLIEVAMSMIVEWRFDKDKILETYFNEVYLGQDGPRAVHGAMAGSYFYFGRPVRELKLHQIALMVAVIKGPAYYNPKRFPERALSRRNLVLDLMVKEGFILPKVANWSKRQPLDVVEHPTRSANRFPAYLSLVHRHLKRDYSEEELSQAGLRVFTSLDPTVQWQLENSTQQGLDQLAARYGTEANDYQTATVVTSVDNGEVIAMVGDRNVGFSGFNRALDAKRPIGSLAKPAVFLTALKQPQQYTLASILKDQPFTATTADGQQWSPKNFDNVSHGDVPLYLAFANSYNQATARLGLELGLPKVVDTFEAFGFEDPVAALPSTLLGAVSLSPYEVAKMYQVLAADGFRAPLKVIRTVTDNKGEVLDSYPLDVEQVFEHEAVYLTDYAMQLAAREGTGRWLNQVIPGHIPVFGKTGTSNQQRDSWFAGVVGNYMAVSWIGRDDNKPTKLTGSTGALRLWGDFMSSLDVASEDRVVPEGVSFHWIDNHTGTRTDENCPTARLLPFIDGSAPQSYEACSVTPENQSILEKFLKW
jgi:penicillin-binding protein 1B